jgi:8-oxo-dGTP pyrophosphatase MutT (NUDIX family)
VPDPPAAHPARAVWWACHAGSVLREFPLAGRLAERVDSDGQPLHEPPPVRRAATVLLLRDRATALEVFAFRRVPRMVFAPGMLVFPGGSVDAADADPALPWDVPVEEAAAPTLAAAVRETFEECGVLLALDASGRAPDAGELASPAWEERRIGLAEGRLTLAGVLTQAALAGAASALRPWARWVTPEFERRRFDTWFYLARLPDGQEARDLGGEGELAAWLDPADALERHAAGELPMLPPTQVCLEELAVAASVDEVLATARTVLPVSPWVERGGDGLVLRVDLDGRGGGAAR